MKHLLSALGAAVLLAAVPAVSSAENMNLMLNWTPTADHSPIYYAKSRGWYSEAGIDNITAVMVIYANSPQGFYWLKSSGITGPKDFPGHKIGNPPGDAARLMWPAFAKKVGIDPNSVTFVNISPPAKVVALKSKAIDIISDFYNEHDLKAKEFGADLGFVPWRSIGVNVYGNSLIVNNAYLAANKERVARFTAITQRAYEACVKDFNPCLQALTAAVSGLNPDNQRDQWERIKTLMRDDTTTKLALGAFDPARVKSDYELVSSLIGIEKAFDPATMFTNDFLDKKIHMPAN